MLNVLKHSFLMLMIYTIVIGLYFALVTQQHDIQAQQETTGTRAVYVQEIDNINS